MRTRSRATQTKRPQEWDAARTSACATGLYCELTLRQSRLFWWLLAAALVATRMCHSGLLWEGDAYPLAGAQQILHGKALYRDIWFDKPPLLPLAYLLFGALPGWPLRLAGVCYGLLACWIAYAFGRELWSEREGRWAAALLGFSLCFDFPAAAIPVASDLLMLAPHLAAVWLASRRPFWSGVLAAVAFWINPKGALVALVCVLWNPAGAVAMAAGFAAVSAAMLASLAGTGALAPYWEQVWRWGRLYAASPFEGSPLRNGIMRTLGWAGFHAAIVTAAAWCWIKGGLGNDRSVENHARVAGRKAEMTLGSAGLTAPDGARASRATVLGFIPLGKPEAQRAPREGAVAWVVGISRTACWVAWLVLSLAGVAAGLRFFPRYYSLLLPVVVMMGARGFALMKGRARFAVCLLLLIPVIRFAPAYWAAARNSDWRDTAMDRDSRAAAALVRATSKPGDTLFVWGYRPEDYVYTRLPAATMYLDSQPLTGVPADRHLTQSAPVETEAPRNRRAELTRSAPSFILDGLGLYNPRLAIGNYSDLHAWLGNYREVGRTGGTVIYRRVAGAGAAAR
jgi:hypothetical protein